MREVGNKGGRERGRACLCDTAFYGRKEGRKRGRGRREEEGGKDFIRAGYGT